MLRRLALFCLLQFIELLLVGSSLAQSLAPDTLWTKMYGAYEDEIGWAIQPTLDGGYIVAGQRCFNPGAFPDAWLIKTDAEGDSAWSRTYGGCGVDIAYSVLSTPDSGFILLGITSDSGSSNCDIRMIKTDACGDSLWSRIFGGTGEDVAYSVQPTADGGFVIAGYTTSWGAGEEDIWLIKTDAEGNSLWEHTLGGSASDLGYAAQQTPDGGYISIATTYSQGAGMGDIWLLKTDAEGTLLWSRTFGGPERDRARSVQVTQDGGFVLVGYTASWGAGIYDVWLIKTNAQGDSLWSRTFGGSNTDEGWSVQQTGDGGYVIGGWTKSFGAGEEDAWVIKCDADGDLMWQRTGGGSECEYGYSVLQTSDGGYMLSGTTASFGSGQQDLYLTRLESASLELRLTPIDPPIIVPEAGATFAYLIGLNSTYTHEVAPEVWCDILMPEGSPYGPVLGPVAVQLEPETYTERQRLQIVPANAPGGTYEFRSYVGFYPNIIFDSTSFAFSKSETGLTLAGHDAASSGMGNNTDLPSAFIVYPPHPNPFNASTTLSFTLPEAGQIRLCLYDVKGKQIAELARGWRDAGLQEITFDGADLASGIYIYRLEAGENITSDKLILLK